MKKYWVVGHPLSFCLTTEVLNGAFEALGIDSHFETKDIEPDKLVEVMQMLKTGELAGLVTTRPHKSPSIDFVEVKSEMVDATNATNLVLNKDGKLHGYNIDGLGAYRALKTVMPDLKDRLVLILGAGGAARAAAYTCKNEGAKVAIWNRTTEKAQKIAEQLGLEWVEDMRYWDSHPEVIINATALSDEPKQSTLVPFPLWARVEVAMDAVYGKTSLFLEEAKAAQVEHVLPGHLWFLKQAIRLFEKITDQDPPVELMTKLTNEADVIRLKTVAE